MNSETELIKALAQLTNTPDPEIEYRLHYDDAGEIITCSMRDPHPDSSRYLVVTKEQYDLYFRYRVVNGKLQLIEHNTGVRRALIPSDGGFRVVAGNASLLVTEKENYQDTEYYDYRTS